MGLITEGRPDWELSLASQHTGITILSVLDLAILCYAACVARRDRVLYPYLVFVAGGLAAWSEPLIDILCVSTFPEINQITAFELYGRKIPVRLILGYIFYYTPIIVWLARRLQAGIGRATWWRFFAFTTVYAYAFEFLMTHAHLYTYWSDFQPPKLLGVPLHLCLLNSGVIVTTAALIHVLTQRILTGVRELLLLPIIPMYILAAWIAPAIPAMSAMHSTTNHALIAFGAVCSVLFSLLLCWVWGEVLVPSGVRQTSSNGLHRQMTAGHASSR